MKIKEMIKDAASRNDTYQIGCITVYFRNMGLDYPAIARLFYDIGGIDRIKYERHMAGFEAMAKEYNIR